MKRMLLIFIAIGLIPGFVSAAADFYVTESSPHVVAPGETVQFDITMKNLGDEYANFLSSEFDPTASVPIKTVGSSKKSLSSTGPAKKSDDVWGSVLQKEMVLINYPIKVASNATLGLYKVPIALSWKNAQGQTGSQTIYVGMEIKGKPDILISSMNTSPSRPLADSDFSLTLGLENSGNDKAEALKAQIMYPSGFSGETTEYLGTLARDGKATVSYDMKAARTVESGIHDFTLKLTYMENGEEIIKEIPFQVYLFERGDIRLEIAGIDTSPTKILPGTEVTLSIQIENIGTQEAKSVKTEIVPGEGFSGTFSSFIGSLKEDDTSTAIFDITAAPTNQAGTYDMKMVLTYLDQKGSEFKEEKGFQLTVDQPPKQSPVGAVVGLVVVVIVVWYLWKRRKAPEV